MISQSIIDREAEASAETLARQLGIDPGRCMHDPFIEIEYRLRLRLPCMDEATAHRCRVAFANLTAMRGLSALSVYADAVSDVDSLIASLDADASLGNGPCADEIDALSEIRKILLAGDARTARRVTEETYGTRIASEDRNYLKPRGRKLLDEGLPPSMKDTFLRFVDKIQFLPDRVPGLLP